MADRPFMRRWEIGRELGISVQNVKDHDGRGLTPIKCEDGWRVKYDRKEAEAFIEQHRPRQRRRQSRRRRQHSAAARTMAAVARLVKEGKSLVDIAIEVPCDPDFLVECYRVAKVPEEELVEERERERHEERMEYLERRHARRLHRLAKLAALTVSGPPPKAT